MRETIRIVPWFVMFTFASTQVMAATIWKCDSLQGQATASFNAPSDWRPDGVGAPLIILGEKRIFIVEANYVPAGLKPRIDPTRLTELTVLSRDDAHIIAINYGNRYAVIYQLHKLTSRLVRLNAYTVQIPLKPGEPPHSIANIFTAQCRVQSP